jgi:hypothetical protein
MPQVMKPEIGDPGIFQGGFIEFWRSTGFFSTLITLSPSNLITVAPLEFC